MTRPGPQVAEERYQFFGGKGGVGKTTCAAAAAASFALAGQSVLLVSLDPAHSLGDAFDRRLGPRATRIATPKGRLDAVELDADAALAQWIERRRPALRRVLAHGTYLDDDDIEELLRLSLPGVDELIGLLELTRIAGQRRYDRVVVDAAPTGHLLRLLAMPEALTRLADVLDAMHAKHRFLAEALVGAYRPDTGDRLIADVHSHAERLSRLLRDPARCRVSWVLLPEAMTLAEARDGADALRADGIAVSDLVVNRVSDPRSPDCGTCSRRIAYERAMLDRTRRVFPAVPLRLVPALADEPRGMAKLRRIGRRLVSASSTWPAQFVAARRTARPSGKMPAPATDDRSWLDALAPLGVRLLLFSGKGGVGKTSCAAAVALQLSARPRGRRVLLLSVDPAHSVGDVMGLPVGDMPRPIGPGSLDVRELDARALLDVRRQRYLEAVDDVFDTLASGSRFDPSFDRVVIERLVDLAPPGLDELLGLLEVLAAVRLTNAARPVYDTVVVDTAPTGHTLRLLAMPRAGLQWVHAFMALWLKYRKVIGLADLGWDLVSLSRDLRDLQSVLSDPRQTSAVVVTRPADLPGLETARLIAGLRRFGMTVSGGIMNAMTPSECPRRERARHRERRAVAILASALEASGADGCSIVEAPAVAPPPRGPASLARWARSWRRTA